jgi:hypothetical protein
MGEFECPVEECNRELSRLQVMHFRARHDCDPNEWVQRNYGSEIKMRYKSGNGCYTIADEYEWLSSDMVESVVDTRSHRESVSGENNPMKRDKVRNQFRGEKNPAKQPSVREKIREANTGCKLSEEAKKKISRKNTGNEISESHREAIAKASTSMDRSYMQTEEYRQTLSNSLKGREPTYPSPYEVEELTHPVRSSWEEEIGRLLSVNGVEYDYETAFELATSTYYPDFITETNVIEVKGWANDRSVKKAELFMQEYSSYTYIVVGDKIPCDRHIPWEQRAQLIEVINNG